MMLCTVQRKVKHISSRSLSVLTCLPSCQAGVRWSFWHCSALSEHLLVWSYVPGAEEWRTEATQPSPNQQLWELVASWWEATVPLCAKQQMYWSGSFLFPGLVLYHRCKFIWIADVNSWGVSLLHLWPWAIQWDACVASANSTACQ